MTLHLYTSEHVVQLPESEPWMATYGLDHGHLPATTPHELYKPNHIRALEAGVTFSESILPRSALLISAKVSILVSSMCMW